MSIIKMAALPLMLFCAYGGFKFCLAHVECRA